MMLVAMVDVSLEGDDNRSSASLAQAWKIISKGSRNMSGRDSARRHPVRMFILVRGMGDTSASGRLLASGATCDGNFPIAGQSVSGPSSTGYSGASATDFHRLPLPALECSEPWKMLPYK